MYIKDVMKGSLESFILLCGLLLNGEMSNLCKGSAEKAWRLDQGRSRFNLTNKSSTLNTF